MAATVSQISSEKESCLSFRRIVFKSGLILDYVGPDKDTRADGWFFAQLK